MAAPSISYLKLYIRLFGLVLSNENSWTNSTVHILRCCFPTQSNRALLSAGIANSANSKNGGIHLNFRTCNCERGGLKCGISPNFNLTHAGTLSSFLCVPAPVEETESTASTNSAKSLKFAVNSFTSVVTSSTSSAPFFYRNLRLNPHLHALMRRRVRTHPHRTAHT